MLMLRLRNHSSFSAEELQSCLDSLQELQVKTQSVAFRSSFAPAPEFLRRQGPATVPGRSSFCANILQVVLNRRFSRSGLECWTQADLTAKLGIVAVISPGIRQ